MPSIIVFTEVQQTFIGPEVLLQPHVSESEDSEAESKNQCCENKHIQQVSMYSTVQKY